MESDEFLVDSFIDDEFPMDVSSDVLPEDYSEVMDAVQDPSNVHYLIQMPVGSNILSGNEQTSNVYNIVNSQAPIILTTSNMTTTTSTRTSTFPTYPVLQRVQGQPQQIQQQQQVVVQQMPVQHPQQQQPVQQQPVQQRPQQQQQAPPNLNEDAEDEGDDFDGEEEDEEEEEKVQPVAKVVKQRKPRKKKDKNAPPAPLSAYAFFFRETQAKVKSQNPAAKFGDVSRSVAALWETLGENEKAVYKNLSVEDHARHDAAMKVYKASQSASQGENSATPKAKSVKVVYLGGKMMTTTTTSPVKQQEVSIQNHPLFQGASPVIPPKANAMVVKPEDLTDNECIRAGCKNFAIKSPEWEDEYCSNDCAITHCKAIFASFVAGSLKV